MAQGRHAPTLSYGRRDRLGQGQVCHAVPAPDGRCVIAQCQLGGRKLADRLEHLEPCVAIQLFGNHQALINQCRQIVDEIAAIARFRLGFADRLCLYPGATLH